MAPVSLRGLRVLVVEDESPVALLIEDMLEALGCRVAAAAGDVQTALEQVDRADFDLALLDVNLAGESAFPVAEALRARARPFAFVTGYGPERLPAGFRDSPALAKPFRREDLRSVLEAALRPTSPDESGQGGDAA